MTKYDGSERFRTLNRHKTALSYDENSALNTECVPLVIRAVFGSVPLKVKALSVALAGKAERKRVVTGKGERGSCVD